jgi:hypothetical protein
MEPCLAIIKDMMAKLTQAFKDENQKSYLLLLI